MTEVSHADNVIALHPFSELQALDDLRALGRTRLRNVDLARRWQWSRKRAGNALKRWAKQRLIARRRGIIVPLGEPSSAPPTPANDVHGARPVARPRPVLVAPTLSPPPHEARESPVAPAVPATNAHKWLGALAILLGCALSLIGLGWSLLSLARGQSGLAGGLMAAVCIGIELVAALSPSFATALWRIRCHALALAIWAGYAIALATVIFNGFGFVNMQLGDMVAGRAGAIGTTSDLRAELAARIQEKRGLTFAPVDPAMVETAEDRRDTACDGGKKTCEQLRADVTALGRQRATNERLVALDGEIKILRGKLELAPAVGSADPQVESAMKVLALASVSPSRDVLETGRLLLLVLIPCVMGGLLLPAGILLWQGRKA